MAIEDAGLKMLVKIIIKNRVSVGSGIGGLKHL